MSAATYRKKPLEVQAVLVADLLRDAATSYGDLPSWVRDAYEARDLIFADDHIDVETLEGLMQAPREWWLIQGVKGELYPCAPDVFDLTYEPVTVEHVRKIYTSDCLCGRPWPCASAGSLTD